MTEPSTTPPSSADDMLFVDGAWRLDQSYTEEPMLRRFFDAVREHRQLLGARVEATGRVIFPPRRVCERSYREVDALVPVGPGGVIVTVTRVMTRMPIAPDPPYVVAFARLDGADTASPAYLRGPGADRTDLLSLIGRRCRVAFAAEPVGDWADFWYELVEDAAT